MDKLPFKHSIAMCANAFCILSYYIECSHDHEEFLLVLSCKLKGHGKGSDRHNKKGVLQNSHKYGIDKADDNNRN